MFNSTNNRGTDDRLVRETLSKNTSSVPLLFEPALPLGTEHSLGQPGTSLFYMFNSIVLNFSVSFCSSFD